MPENSSSIFGTTRLDTLYLLADIFYWRALRKLIFLFELLIFSYCSPPPTSAQTDQHRSHCRPEEQHYVRKFRCYQAQQFGESDLGETPPEPPR